MDATKDFGNGIQATKAFVGSNVEDLPVIEMHDGYLSCWEPTDEEIQQLIANRRLYLWVRGPAHPPVALTTEPLPAPATPASRDGERKKIVDA